MVFGKVSNRRYSLSYSNIGKSNNLLTWTQIIIKISRQIVCRDIVLKLFIFYIYQKSMKHVNSVTKLSDKFYFQLSWKASFQHLKKYTLRVKVLPLEVVNNVLNYNECLGNPPIIKSRIMTYGTQCCDGN